MIIITIAIQCTGQTALLYILTQWLKKITTARFGRVEK